MKKINLIYDDRVKPCSEIASINGGRSFGRTIYKRKNLTALAEEASGMTMQRLSEGGEDELRLTEDCPVCHLYSSFLIKDSEAFEIVLKKASFAREAYRVNDRKTKRTALIIFPDIKSYRKYLENGKNNSAEDNYSAFESDAFSYIGDQSSFLDFITGGFDARFFNAIEGDYYTVTKRSTNKDKIKREYNFYYCLPEAMRYWFVQPFDLREDEDGMSYTMERLHMTDIAVRYVHGAVDESEMGEILDTLFHFTDTRAEKSVSFQEYCKIRDSLYLEKLRERVGMLKETPGFEELEGYIKVGTEFGGIDDVISLYEKIYEDLIILKDVAMRNSQHRLVVGHGDLCFSNILFQKDAHLLRLIDPKGGMTSDELYTDEYYDLAKLSHSICGNYDLFNSGQFEIEVGKNMKFELNVNFDNSSYITLFKERVIQRGYDFDRIRLCEASLFLSMLPLHMDNVRKVFGFILNAIGILKELGGESKE